MEQDFNGMEVEEAPSPRLLEQLNLIEDEESEHKSSSNSEAKPIPKVEFDSEAFQMLSANIKRLNVSDADKFDFEIRCRNIVGSLVNPLISLSERLERKTSKLA
jgi:hypothetical protein